MPKNVCAKLIGAVIKLGYGYDLDFAIVETYVGDYNILVINRRTGYATLWYSIQSFEYQFNITHKT